MSLADRFRRLDWLSALIASPFAIILAWLVTALIDRQPPIIYERARALSAEVPQGGIIDVEFTVFRLRICDALARRWLIDAAGERHAIPSFTVGPRLLAGLDTYRRTISIPQAAALGQATYEVRIAYFCNPLHYFGWPITVVSPPVRFDITKRPAIVLPPLFAPPETDG